MHIKTSEPDGGDHRLFFALWPDDDLRDALAAAIEGMPDFACAGRRVATEKYHLTLHFLGGWAANPDGVIGAATQAAAEVDAKAFHLVVDRAGGFRGARVGWLAPSGNSGLDALWSGLRHGLDDARVAYRAHETFAPHVTVVRNVRDPIEERSIEPVSWPVQDFVLVHSHAGAYELVARWPLRTE